MNSLLEELQWRGFINQTTLDRPEVIDESQFIFYWGVDPSADSMTIGNLAMAMMVKHFIKHGHKAILLVGGATGMIGDPDGKAEERILQTRESINKNKQGIVQQYQRLFAGLPITIVDNYDWFKGMNYLQFLRDIGKHVPMRQMLGREFIQTRLSEEGNGISYAEFSYVLIQAYDFLYLNQQHGVNLQLCGSDQWGNCIAGVDLIRRITGNSVNVWSAPLVVNPTTGVKFGKSEGGAIWLNETKTSPTSFYQFWVNSDDDAVEYYLKLYTELSREEIDDIMRDHAARPQARTAQFKLADEVTKLVHGEQAMKRARSITSYISGRQPLSDANNDEIEQLKSELPFAKVSKDGSIIEALTATGLATSNTVSRKLLADGAVYINHQKVSRDTFQDSDFSNGLLLLRRGKAYKDTALVILD